MTIVFYRRTSKMMIKTVRWSVVALSVSDALCSAALAQYPQYQQDRQYSPYQQQYPASPQYNGAPFVQSYPNNPAPAAPASWSYDPYTSGLGPCPQRERGDDRCDERMTPTAGQPNYWVKCDVMAGMSGTQADAQCQQVAVHRAYEQAYAQQAAVAQQVAQQAATRAGPLTLPASAYEPVSVDYTTPSDHRPRRVTVKRLNSYSEPATRQVCDTFSRIEVDLGSGASTTATARRCKGPDGQWREA
jgi:hypothetical protein